jgi:SAM-dependent methyltransferase
MDKCGVTVENVLCTRCGLIRARSVLDRGSMAEFYSMEYRRILGEDASSESYLRHQRNRGDSFVRLLRKTGVLNEVTCVFEVGCGAGSVLLPFREEGKTVSGCDVDPTAVATGNSMGLDLRTGGFSEQPLENESIDLIILSHVLEHLPDPVQELTMVLEKLRPGKLLLIEVPGLFWRPSERYFNPLDEFQVAHVVSYFHYTFLSAFLAGLGLEEIHGDQTCTFIVRKPCGWTRRAPGSVQYARMDEEVEEIVAFLRDKNRERGLLSLPRKARYIPGRVFRSIRRMIHS